MPIRWIAGDHSSPRLPPASVCRKPGSSGSCAPKAAGARRSQDARRSEEHTSELQSLMRISYAVFCLKKKKKIKQSKQHNQHIIRNQIQLSPTSITDNKKN